MNFNNIKTQEILNNISSNLYEKLYELKTLNIKYKKVESLNILILCFQKIIFGNYSYFLKIFKSQNSLQILGKKEKYNKNNTDEYVSPPKFFQKFKKNIDIWRFSFIKIDLINKPKNDKFIEFQLNNHFKEQVNIIKNIQMNLNKKNLEDLKKIKIYKDENLINFTKFINKKLLIDFKNNIEKYNLNKKNENNFFNKKWKSLFKKMTGERSIWADRKKINSYWKLNKTEDNLRRRLKLKKNYNFNKHIDASKKRDFDFNKHGEETKMLNKNKEELLNNKLNILQQNNQLFSGMDLLNHSNKREKIEKNIDEKNKEINKINKINQFKINDNVRNNNHNNIEKFLIKKPCTLKTIVYAAEGSFEISNLFLYFHPNNNTKYKNNEKDTKSRSDGSSSNNDNKEKQIDKEKGGEGLRKKGKLINKKIWKINSIINIYKRRYCLTHNALEIFLTNKKNFLIIFENKKIRDQIYKKIKSTKPPNLMKFFYTGNPTKAFKKWKYTKLWQNRSISNFEYLMKLNTLANRSYNDLAQYPIFPWILINYKSEKIDLNDPKNYRNLSKPMGALSQKRLKECKTKYKTLAKNSDSLLPPFLYGSHYSNVGIILYYLIRMEPFTSLSIELQGDKFDRADRIFSSIEKTWQSCLLHQTDYRELIPEFYYSPEFLMNSNNFDLGINQNGEIVNDVELPKWANNSPYQFIQIMREALESDYVSEHLHEWIDLTFGYKQRGEEAIKALNVFYHLTYEGAIDLDQITDPHKKKAIITQIQDFGQCPSQLLIKKPHPKRLSLEQISSEMLTWAIDSFDINNFYSIEIEPNFNILFIGISDQLYAFDGIKRLIIFTEKRDLYCYFLNKSKNTNFNLNNDHNHSNDNDNNNDSNTINDKNSSNSNNNVNVTVNTNAISNVKSNQNLIDKPSNNKNKNKYTYEIQIEKNKQNLQKKYKIGMSLSSEIKNFSNAFDFSSDGRLFFSCGHFDNSFKITDIVNFSTLKKIIYHKDIVTCLKFKNNILLTASKDTTAIIWNCLQKNEGSIIKLEIIHILNGHDDEITCCDFNIDLDLVVTGSKDGTLILHSLLTGQYIRSINSGVTLLLTLTNDGEILIYSNHNIQLYSINGKLINKIPFAFEINCWKFIFYKNKKYLLIGTRNGLIFFFSLPQFKIIKKKISLGQPITSIGFDKNIQKILFGTAKGIVFVI
ncbi:beige/beach-related [Anaeramoeba flamelloides]|uniref:Beige/beach-related n=1 Tax=Anaeramoeba flamelloides TaxID=1746091 RepID=A0AAV7Y3Y3_9EUKA|nr:beige/beach-related [Anaeramoeba flamelloides]